MHPERRKMAFDKIDQESLEEIAAYVGLEKEDRETWPAFTMRILKAYDEPILKAQYGTTIDRLVRLANKIMQK